MALDINTSASLLCHSFTDEDPEYWFLFPLFEEVPAASQPRRFSDHVTDDGEVHAEDHRGQWRL